MKLLASRNIVTIKQGSGTYVASSPGIVDDPFGFTFISDKKKLVQDYVMRLKSLWNKKKTIRKKI